MTSKKSGKGKPAAKRGLTDAAEMKKALIGNFPR